MSRNKPSDQLPDFSLLRNFCVIAGSASLTEAAAKCDLSQPALSQQLQRLEAALGVLLIERNTRPIRLTRAGKRLAEGLPSQLQDLVRLVEHVRSTPNVSRKKLRIAMPDSMSCTMGAEFLSVATSLAESVELSAGISPWADNALLGRSFDLMVDSPPYDTLGYVNPTKIFIDPYVLVYPASLPRKRPEDFVVTDPQIAYAPTTKFGVRAARIARQLGADTEPAFSFDSSQSLLRFVQVGYGWAVTSVLCLYQTPAALRDLSIFPAPPEACRTLMLLSRTEEMQELSRDVNQRLVKVFRELVDGPWQKMSPEAARFLRGANPDIFTDPETPSPPG